ncbi:MAG: AbiH family protein, partial [Flavobacteriaceae bacterium]
MRKNNDIKRKKTGINRKKRKKKKRLKLLREQRSNRKRPKLYILGNGFDLWHDLPTSYKDFYESEKSVLDDLEWYYGFRIQLDNPWFDFENSLGCFDWLQFFDVNNHTDILSDDFKI